MKKLIDIGVCQYSFDALEQAKKDADDAANDVRHLFNKRREVKFVLKGRDGYFGPMNGHKRKDIVWRSLEEVYTAYPKEANELIGRIRIEAQWLQNVEVKPLSNWYISAYDPYQGRNIQFVDTKDFDAYLEALAKHRNKEKR